MTTPAARGAHGYEKRIRSLAITSGASIFRGVRSERVADLAQRLANSHPYTTLDDEGLRNAVLNLSLKDPTYFTPLYEIEANARGARFERIEVSSISEAIKQMSAAERLEHHYSKAMPSRFQIAPKIVVKDVDAALAACNPQQRIRYNETYVLPDNIVIQKS
jgi:hypothetical protein